ncbi:3183_t:CDS:2 [Acaulospora colombiana]|uniref:3183_t:CDS:1 n=1 Tax=Acaulospora colombiana TaxID=27376 RepID=A0ACA9KCR0_9GLOM|nr:3183_t:CDS:2 [Acaulospora colombiana]
MQPPTQTTTRKPYQRPKEKPNVTEKTARSVKENPANLESTSSQTQQLRTRGLQALTRMNDPSSLS